MPARCARTMVPAMVVPPYALKAHAVAMSLLETLTLGLASASSNNCSFESPTCTFPRRTAYKVRLGSKKEISSYLLPIVAGMAPLSRTRRSTSRQVSMLVGCGIPWVRIAVSSATTGPPCCKACSTSSEITSPSTGWEVTLSNGCAGAR